MCFVCFLDGGDKMLADRGRKTEDEKDCESEDLELVGEWGSGIL